MAAIYDTEHKPNKGKGSEMFQSIGQRLNWQSVGAVAAALLVIIGIWLKLGLNPNTGQMHPFNGVRRPLRSDVATTGLTPARVKTAYGLKEVSTGSGTVAIIDAYDAPTIESDLGVFDRHFSLKTCTTSDGCLEKHKMSTTVAASADWSTEVSLDVEWAHAIAPGAKILLVEATSASRTSLLKAVDYARERSDVVAISMSWGGDEFATESHYDYHFASPSGASFFASAGDDGHGASWPATSPRVIAVGGTTLNLSSSGRVDSETAWSGSGGGVSAYLSEPDYQSNYGLNSGGHRAVPDVSYDADPNTGYPVYDSTVSNGTVGWFVVGGTSAGAPQWAALKSIDPAIGLTQLYADATTGSFRDISSGSNGSCGTDCRAAKGYDYVTGLGSPLGAQF